MVVPVPVSDRVCRTTAVAATVAAVAAAADIYSCGESLQTGRCTNQISHRALLREMNWGLCMIVSSMLSTVVRAALYVLPNKASDTMLGIHTHTHTHTHAPCVSSLLHMVNYLHTRSRTSQADEYRLRVWTTPHEE
ncbi:hypothetical protein BD289DRAFT_182363 [Coniella lustricola]|uniref:Uncharacterized protein n=1 Tax=Coniella lustricola TaxID=2025994 RepID=A0A2T2ZTC1_9PEZI|nr:hypothetical protein BD289DRAFT_182363 [Coniella lustricola]